MPYKARKSLSPSEEQEVVRLHLQGVPLRQLAEQFDSSYGTVQRLTRRHRLALSNGQPEPPEVITIDHLNKTNRRNVTARQSAPASAPTNTLQHVLIGEAVSPDERIDDTAALKVQLLELKAEVDTLKAHRLEIDAWVEAFQRQAHSSAPERASVPERTSAPEWIKRGTHIAADMANALRDYAAKHRLEVREVHDLALREFFARHGSPAEEDEQ